MIYNKDNNNQKTAILFTKTRGDTKDVGLEPTILATAGSIAITSGIGATAGLVYNCGATTTANGFVSTSDYRLKENFASLDNDPSNPVSAPTTKRGFNYIGDAETVDGFIAHAMEAAPTPLCLAPKTLLKQSALCVTSTQKATSLRRTAGEPKRQK